MPTIDIHTLSEYEAGNAPMGYYAKGRYEPDAFLEVLKDWVYPEPLPEGEPIYEHWRVVPSGDKGMPGWFKAEKEKARGTFEVTVIYI